MASKGEEQIISLLRKWGYRFIREKTFSDLKKGRYRFDFYVYSGRPQECMLELQGQQHYVRVKKFHPTARDFRAQQERDRRKISYCLANRIPLYIIPYWELPNITKAEQLFNPKYLARDRWKNDKDWQAYQHKI